MTPRSHSVGRSWRWLGLFVVVIILVSQLPVGQQLNLGMSPVLSALQAPARWWQDLTLWFEQNRVLRQRLEQTETELARIAALQQELSTLRDENLKLRQLLDIKQIKGYDWHAVRVQGRSPDKMSQHLILLADHARQDDVIVSREGLVGLVDQAQKGSAVVRTILDASLAVPVTMKTVPIAALARGQGDRLLIDFVPIHQAPPVGATLYTSGAGGLFPAGIPVARITQVDPVPGEVFAQIQAVPVAHWQRENWLALASPSLDSAE